MIRCREEGKRPEYVGNGNRRVAGQAACVSVPTDKMDALELSLI